MTRASHPAAVPDREPSAPPWSERADVRAPSCGYAVVRATSPSSAGVPGLPEVIA